MKKNVDSIGKEKMTDQELSQAFGRYQRRESIGILLGALLVIAGCISAFVQHNLLLVCILVFAGVGLILLLALPAQKKKKALMEQQMGGFFRTELTRAFGPEPQTPELPIDYKLAVRQENPHYGNAGVLEEELGIFVPMLVDAGVTSFHVTLANHSSLEDTIPPANHPYFKGQGCFLKFCDEVRKYTDKPITGVGGLTDPDFVEEQLSSGRITCAAMSRQLLADPAWPNKVAAGQCKEIHRCVRCNKKCLGGLQQHQGTHCIYEKG